MKLAELTEMYEMMTRAAEQGANDGANNIPDPNATRLTPTEANIRNLAQDQLNDLGGAQRSRMDRDLTRIAAEASKIPFVIRRTLGEFRVIAEGIVQEAGYELINLYKTKLERDTDYRHFKAVHGLQREAAPARSLFEAWSYYVLMLVIDGSVNAYFFKDVGTLGLVDGFLIAGIIAACNIALGFTIGWGPLRFMGHRFKLHLLWAVPVFVLLVLVLLMFNWGIAHYRDLIQVNREGGLPDVWAMLRDNPYGLLSFPSYLMALVGVGIAIYSAARAYIMFDAYPWYGWTYKRKVSAESDFLEEAGETKKKIHAEGEKFVKSAADEYAAVYNAAHKVLGDYDRVIGMFGEYEAGAMVIEEACNATLDTYREQNRRVRDNERFPPPLYFDVPVKLTRRTDLEDPTEVTNERKALHERAEGLRRAQEELAKNVPNTKLELLSEASMNSRLERITGIAVSQHANDRILEAEEREAVAV